MKNYTISVNDDCKIKIKVNGFRCLRCGHRWIPRVELEQLEKDIKKIPRICPNCKSAYWYDFDLEVTERKSGEGSIGFKQLIKIGGKKEGENVQRVRFSARPEKDIQIHSIPIN